MARGWTFMTKVKKTDKTDLQRIRNRPGTAMNNNHRAYWGHLWKFTSLDNILLMTSTPDDIYIYQISHPEMIYWVSHPLETYVKTSQFLMTHLKTHNYDSSWHQKSQLLTQCVWSIIHEPSDDLIVIFIHIISFSNHKANLKRFQLINQMVFLSQSLIISNQQKQNHCNDKFDDDSQEKYNTYVRFRWEHNRCSKRTGLFQTCSVWRL